MPSSFPGLIIYAVSCLSLLEYRCRSKLSCANLALAHPNFVDLKEVYGWICVGWEDWSWPSVLKILNVQPM
jgi:hypothetical protein